MGSKALLRLVIVLAVVGVLAAIVKFAAPGTVESVSGSGNDREKVFPEFPQDVAKIRITTADEEVNLVRGKKTWEVAERGGHPANTREIVDFVRKVWDLKVIQAPQIGPSQFERLELVDPAKGPVGNTATVVSFQNAEGKELEALWLGKIYERAEGRPSPFGGPSTTEVGRYVKPGGEDVVFLVDETFSDIEPDPAGWLNEDFFKVEKIKTIAMGSKPREGKDEDDKDTDTWTEADNWKLTRDDVTADFTLVDAAEGEELDGTKVSSMKSAFSGPKFDDVVVGDEAKENQPDLNTYTVETFDGFTYVVKTSKKEDGGELYLTYAVDGKFPDKRKPGEEESDEEKAKLDKEFDENLKKLREKLAAEKAIAGKVYKVRGFVIDSITKKRSELMKGEEKPEGAAPPGSANIPGLPPGLNIPGLPPGTIQLPKDGGGVPLNFQPAPAPADPAPKPADPAPAPSKPAPDPDKPKQEEPAKPSDDKKKPEPATPADGSKPKPAEKPDGAKAEKPPAKPATEASETPESSKPKPETDPAAEEKPAPKEAPAPAPEKAASSSEGGEDS